MNVYALPVVFVILVAAYFDFFKKRIPDFVLAGSWIVSFISAPYYSDLVVACFGLLYLVNTLCIRGRKSVFGWGDILIAPIYFLACRMLSASVWGAVGLFAIGFGTPFVLSWYYKKKYAVAPWMGLVLLILLFN